MFICTAWQQLMECCSLSSCTLHTLTHCTLMLLLLASSNRASCSSTHTLVCLLGTQQITIDLNRLQGN